jgi:hypothetical protein
MSEKASKYGFGGGGIQLPKMEAAPPRQRQEAPDLSKALKAGNDLGFVSREPSNRRKPGPKRTEAQDKVSIPGPKRIIDRYRAYCAERNLTLWQGLEDLLDEADRR